MLEIDETRNEIFNTIISGHEYSKELMLTMMMSNNKDMLNMIKDMPNMMDQMMNMMYIEDMMDKETMMKNKEKIGAETHSGHH